MAIEQSAGPSVEELVAGLDSGELQQHDLTIDQQLKIIEYRTAHPVQQIRGLKFAAAGAPDGAVPPLPPVLQAGNMSVEELSQAIEAGTVFPHQLTAQQQTQVIDYETNLQSEELARQVSSGEISYASLTEAQQFHLAIYHSNNAMVATTIVKEADKELGVKGWYSLKRNIALGSQIHSQAQLSLASKLERERRMAEIYGKQQAAARATIVRQMQKEEDDRAQAALARTKILELQRLEQQMAAEKAAAIRELELGEQERRRNIAAMAQRRSAEARLSWTRLRGHVDLAAEVNDSVRHALVRLKEREAALAFSEADRDSIVGQLAQPLSGKAAHDFANTLPAYMQLKRWLVSQNVSPQEVDGCTGKPQMVILMQRHGLQYPAGRIATQ